MLSHNTDRLHTTRLFDGVRLNLTDTVRTAADAKKQVSEWKADGYNARYVKSRSYDDTYHVYVSAEKVAPVAAPEQTEAPAPVAAQEPTPEQGDAADVRPYRTKGFLSNAEQDAVTRHFRAAGIAHEYRHTRAIDFSCTPEQFQTVADLFPDYGVYAVGADGLPLTQEPAPARSGSPEVLTLEVWYTTAPVAYDGFGTVTLSGGDFDGKQTRDGKPLRAVGVAPANSDWQRSRYASGMYPAYDDAQVSALFD